MGIFESGIAPIAYAVVEVSFQVVEYTRMITNPPGMVNELEEWLSSSGTLVGHGNNDGAERQCWKKKI